MLQRVATDNATGLSKEFGYVTYRNSREAGAAIREINNTEYISICVYRYIDADHCRFSGRTIRVERAAIRMV